MKRCLVAAVNVVFLFVLAVPFANGQDDSSIWNGFGHARDWKTSLTVAEKPFLAALWKEKLGTGRAQIIGDGETIYVASGTAEGKQVESTLAACDQDSGKVLWTYKTSSKASSKQESFSGDKPSPQATPVLIGSKVVWATYPGELVCVDAKSGNEVWKIDLCEKFGAQKVQFGFSSSPVGDPFDAQQVLVYAAGERGGLFKFNVETGEVVWASPARTFSYATPVLADLDGRKQWLIISREYLIGVDDENGEQLWKFELNEGGLTNVPTPLVLNEQRILISGQGVKGTQCLEIQNKNGNWAASKVWYNQRLQFFCTNWIKLDDNVIIGCTEKVLTAVDASSGELLGRYRGFGDGNVIVFEDRVGLLNGRGDFSVVNYDSDNSEFVIERKYKLGQSRFWTAPSVIGDQMFVRYDDLVCCYEFRDGPSAEDIENRVQANSMKKLKMTVAEMAPDPVEEVFKTFQAEGQEAALALYSQLRKTGKLSPEQRIALAEAASEQGLKDVANMIMKHAKADLPGSEVIQSKLDEWGGS